MNAIVEKRTNEYKMGPLASCVARSVSSMTASTFVEHQLPLMKKNDLYIGNPPHFTLTRKTKRCIHTRLRHIGLATDSKLGYSTRIPETM